MSLSSAGVGSALSRSETMGELAGLIRDTFEDFQIHPSVKI